MFKTGKLLFLSVSVASLTFVHAKPATCPPASQVKSATLIRATSYDESSDLWELTSAPFSYDGKMWNASYGVELPRIKDPREALTHGQLAYTQASIIYNSPPPDQYPGHFFCDYTNSDVRYWIQVSSPPAF